VPVKKLNIREMRASTGQLEELVNDAGELVVSRRGGPSSASCPFRGGVPPDHADLRGRTRAWTRLRRP